VKPCRFVVKIIVLTGSHVWCCKPGKSTGGTVLCYDHWPASVRA